MGNMDKKSNGILGAPENVVSLFDAFNYLTSGIGNAFGGYYRNKLSKLDARITGQRLANDVRARAVKAASAAIADYLGESQDYWQMLRKKYSPREQRKPTPLPDDLWDAFL
jgi:hypothetical protein